MSRERPWPYDNLPELYCSSGVTRTSNSRGIGCLMQKLLASCFNCVLFDKGSLGDKPCTVHSCLPIWA